MTFFHFFICILFLQLFVFIFYTKQGVRDKAKSIDFIGFEGSIDERY